MLSLVFDALVLQSISEVPSLRKQLSSTCLLCQHFILKRLFFPNPLVHGVKAVAGEWGMCECGQDKEEQVP